MLASRIRICEGYNNKISREICSNIVGLHNSSACAIYVPSITNTLLKIPKARNEGKGANNNDDCRLMFQGVRQINEKIWVIHIYDCGKGVKMVASDTESSLIITRQVDEYEWAILIGQFNDDINYFAYFLQIKNDAIIIRYPRRISIDSRKYNC